MVVPSEWFGKAYLMEGWLREECPGCRYSSRKGEREDQQGGLGCSLPVEALLEPHKDLEQWSPDAGDEPGDLTCMAREERPTSPLKGIRRGPRKAQGQDVLL